MHTQQYPTNQTFIEGNVVVNARVHFSEQLFDGLLKDLGSPGEREGSRGRVLTVLHQLVATHRPVSDPVKVRSGPTYCCVDRPTHSVHRVANDAVVYWRESRVCGF